MLLSSIDRYCRRNSDRTLIFGRTNHHSSRVIFGAAALGAMSERKAEETLSQVNNLGLNHVDVRQVMMMRSLDSSLGWLKIGSTFF